jgi:nicotinamidase-related amidase
MLPACDPQPWSDNNVTISTLDARPALLIVDLQKGIVGLATAHPMADVVSDASRLADAFRSHDLPVVLINVDGGAPGRAEQSRRIGEFPAGWTDLVPELNRRPSDYLVTKRTWGAFTNTDLETYLKQSGVTQVVIAGVSTSAGVESTARHAHELGFNVALAIDAMTDLSADAHLNSVTRIFPRLGETGTTQQIIDLLEAASHAQQRSA